METLPFNMEYVYGKQLREVPVNADDMLKGTNYLIDLLHNDLVEKRTKAKWCSWIGVYSRILGDVSVSEQYLLQSINLYKELDDYNQIFVSSLRLAVTYQWKGQYDQAIACLQQLLSEVDGRTELETYRDFVYQHLGKCYFEQGAYREAIDFFMKAYVIRQVKGDEKLLQSTEYALSQCKAATV
ncbi:hypothetical protein N781_04020 [Pontibacillus halophilus JSM 076056 = DSM 19796]|uniref:Uncharacterized protein n=1 Tax=Pontibacillus halophilus JSM 076056 = DSM 19796 TaxID=1385510 RepID=A0A0A5GKE1_9BACI|nr:tetratricopeptide repeat protein [Pontibacillus halophilus]KGX91698.1 hypothetical protein N781_04020 [Pontibacillus halophilus JSM 076056 = DSM 19796]